MAKDNTEIIYPKTTISTLATVTLQELLQLFSYLHFMAGEDFHHKFRHLQFLYLS